MPLIAPSLLSANFLHLEADLSMLNASAAHWLHYDVMDGVFVPNITFGLPILKALKAAARKPLDVHLMIVQPERYIDAFADAGADVLSIHIEASVHLHRALQAIRARGMKAGVALNPHTSVQQLEDVLELTDVVCLMSVNPGFGGQQFIDRTYDKVRKLRQMIDAQGTGTLIEIDGGVTLQNAPMLVEAGADVLVAGNTVFSAKDPAAMIAALSGVEGMRS